MEENLELRKIFLCTRNPRISNIDMHINGNYFRENQSFEKESQNKSAVEILAYEGSLSNFYDLIHSLSYRGYDPDINKPFVINFENSDKFIVIEGNRRILALKLLYKLMEMPQLSEIENDADDEENVEYMGEFILDKNQKEKENKEKNYKKILEIISDFSNDQKFVDGKDLNLVLNKIDSTDFEKEARQIQIAIFSNHITGKMVGKRNWNRGRTLLMYLSFLSGRNVNDKEMLEEVTKILFRTENDVIGNLRSAQFVKSLIETAGEDPDFYFKKYPVSSLEKSYVKNFIDSNNGNNFSTMIRLNKDNIILDGERTAVDFCKFIIQEHKGKRLTTRFDRSEIANSSTYKAFVNNLSNKKDLLEKGISKTTSHSAIMELSDEEIEQLSETDKSFVNSVRKMDKVKLLENNKLFIDKFTDKKFKSLKNAIQRVYNQAIALEKDMNAKDSYDGVYFNGLLTSTRTLSELLIYFLIASDEFKKWIVNESKNINQYKKVFLKDNKLVNSPTLSNVEIENLVLTGNFPDSYKIFQITKNAYKERRISFKSLNVYLNDIENMSPLSEGTWKWIFHSERHAMESKAVHAPHYFETENKESMVANLNFVTDSLKIFTEIVEKVILNI